MIKGSCLCGKVTFEISGEPSSLSYCHCSRCRKAAGVFSAVVIGKADDLHMLTGEEVIGRYRGPDAKFDRCFCRNAARRLAIWYRATFMSWRRPRLMTIRKFARRCISIRRRNPTGMTSRMIF